jgi:hypothetical protein
MGYSVRVRVGVSVRVRSNIIRHVSTKYKLTIIK